MAFRTEDVQPYAKPTPQPVNPPNIVPWHIYVATPTEESFIRICQLLHLPLGDFERPVTWISNAHELIGLWGYHLILDQPRPQPPEYLTPQFIALRRRAKAERNAGSTACMTWIDTVGGSINAKLGQQGESSL